VKQLSVRIFTALVQDSSVGVATSYRLDGQGIFHNRKEWRCVLPGSYTAGAMSFPRGKCLGRDVEPQTFAEVKVRIELVLLSYL